MTNKSVENNLIENTYFLLFFFLLVATFFVLPSFFISHPPGDAIYHLLWSNAYADLFWQGQILPSWSNHLNAGCGAGHLLFYPPLSYIVTSLFEPLDFDKSGWTPLLLTAILAITAGGYGSFKLFKEYSQDKLSALLASIFYIFSISSATLFYHTFLYAFFISTMLAPFLLFHALRIGQGYRISVFHYALFLAIILITNYPGLVIFGGMSLCLILYTCHISKTRFTRILTYTFFATLLGLLATSFVTLPLYFLLESTLYKASSYNEAHTYYNNFLSFSDNKNPQYNIFNHARIIANYIVYISVFVSIVIFASIRRQNKKPALFWLLSIIATAFLTQEISQPIWEIIPLLPYIQFPLRLFVILNISMAALIAIYISTKPFNNPLMKLIPIFLIVVLVPFANLSEKAIYSTRVNQRDWDRTQTLKILPYNLNLHREATPFQTLKSHNNDYSNIVKLCSKKVTTSEEKNNHITITKWENKNIEFTTDYPTNKTIIVSQLFFSPLWHAAIDEETVNISSDKKTGLIRLDVPAGKHNVTISMPPTSYQLYGYSLSTLSLCIILFGLYKHQNFKIKGA